jgi:hypothetical protein
VELLTVQNHVLDQIAAKDLQFLRMHDSAVPERGVQTTYSEKFELVKE